MIFRPGHGHRRGFAPAACLCPECSELVLLMRCRARDAQGRQCGDYRGHRRRSHILVVATVFQVALERVDHARFGELPTWGRNKAATTPTASYDGRHDRGRSRLA